MKILYKANETKITYTYWFKKIFWLINEKIGVM